MNFLKKNVKLFLGFIIGLILASGVAVYAYSYYAKDIGYTKPGTNTEISVETALNELYNKVNTKQWAEGNTTLPSDLMLEITNLDFKPTRLTLIISYTGGRIIYVVNNNNEVVYSMAENQYGEWARQDFGTQITLLDNGFKYISKYSPIANGQVYWFAAK